MSTQPFIDLSFKPTSGPLPTVPTILNVPSVPQAPRDGAVSYSYVQENPSTFQTVMGVASLAAGVALTYHGYKRGGIWPALGWGLLGGIVWPITLPIAIAQGFGKKA